VPPSSSGEGSVSGPWRTAHHTIPNSAAIGIFRKTINQTKVQAFTAAIVYPGAAAGNHAWSAQDPPQRAPDERAGDAHATVAADALGEAHNGREGRERRQARRGGRRGDEEAERSPAAARRPAMGAGTLVDRRVSPAATARDPRSA